MNSLDREFLEPNAKGLFGDGKIFTINVRKNDITHSRIFFRDNLQEIVDKQNVDALTQFLVKELLKGIDKELYKRNK